MPYSSVTFTPFFDQQYTSTPSSLPPQVLSPNAGITYNDIRLFNTHLRYRTFTRTEIQHFSRTIKQVINLLTSNIIQLRTFAATHFDNPTTIKNIVEHTTLILSIFNVDSVPNIPNQLLSPSPKIFKTLLSSKKHNRLSCPCPAPQPPPTTHAPSFLLNSSKWSSFWRLDIPLRSRTIWFKIVHNSIPHTSFLHLCNIQRFPSPLCPLCLQEPDSLIHFFYTCNKVQPVWIKISSLFIDNAWQYTIHHFLSDISAAVATLSPFPLRDPRISLVPSLSSSQIVACVLQAIWSARWQFIFHFTPFLSDNVFLQAQKLIHLLDAEIRIDEDI
ncbi:hypothetical protein G6F46_013027 [Rhizopus delemar]|uniref:Reverse transcriptase zinc-binding domain-containing protein n=1 Tax=Rhizopus oryzae TaxID=64495 RepID=A0A9P6XZX1_RHIOR|nr:hypothetical protein G6F51_011294 [Rhizopus arrhizus]KAG1542787.1 hypothetical protein G6F49_011531 [Rhizopus delemar]KAG1576735.1 hypothetical protein G6F48_013095 [Rhizopus delemar]KAG1606411.1 hypothetical protein G6F46_013027 [Rhizopus delemar]